jgi:hypothetical protein
MDLTQKGKFKMDKLTEIILILSLLIVCIYAMQVQHETNILMQKIHDQIMIIKG